MRPAVARRPARSSLGGIAGLFLAAFLISVVVLTLLGAYGLAERTLGIVLVSATLATFIVAGLHARTMQTSEFYLAGRAVPALANAMATAAAFLSGAIFLGLAGIIFADPKTAELLILGWSFGFLMLAVLVAPYFRKSGAFGLAGFLAVRYGGRLVRLLAAVIVATALISALAAALAAAAWVAVVSLDLAPTTALAMATVIVLTSILFGGMRALTLTAVIQFVVLALGFVAPVAVASLEAFSMPIPHLAFGYAESQAATLAAEQGVTLALPIASRFLSFAAESGFASFAAIVSLAAGVAALPHLLMRSATVPDVHAARRSVGWSLVCVLLVVLAAPAYAAFAKLALLSGITGVGVDALPGWLFAAGKLGLVEICGAEAASAEVVAAACGVSTGAAAPLTAADVVFAADAIVLLLPQMVGFPHIMFALVAVAALAAALAAAAALAFAIGGALGHDLYGKLIGIRASAGRRLAITRLLLILTVVFAAWLAANRLDDVLALALTALSFSAGGLFPALFLAVWWPRANAAGAVAGMFLGFATTAAIALAHHYPVVAALAPVDLNQFGLSELTAAIVGLPVGFVVIVVVSLITRPPSPEQRAVLDAIRRPGGAPFVHEDES